MLTKKGFTLIELMIVIAIIAFLAAIGIPQLLQYKARAYQAEVAMNLASLHTAQQAHFAQHGRYSTKLGGEQGLGWKPAGYSSNAANTNCYYTYGFNIPDGQEGVSHFTGKLNAPKEALGQATVTEQGFIAAAAADLSGKGNFDVWTIDENRTIKHVKNGLE